MDRAIQKYFSTYIIDKKKLSGGVSFETYLLDLANTEKVIFRTGDDYITLLKDKVYIEQVFLREKLFYEAVRRELWVDIPRVRVIDSSKKYYDKTFQIYDYIEGIPLDQVNLSSEDLKNVYYDIGRIVGKIHKQKVTEEHRVFLRKENWNIFFARRLELRLTSLIKNSLITKTEVDEISNYCQKIIPQIVEESFLHLDIRFNNFLYKNKICALLDAENIEIGDAAYEMMRLDVYGLLNKEFIAGYNSTGFQLSLDKHNIINKLYKLESISFLLNVFLNDIDQIDDDTLKLISEFKMIKSYIIRT